MPDIRARIYEHVQAAVIDAFELMCFTSVEPDPGANCPDRSSLAGEVEFHGDAEGRLRLTVSRLTAMDVASNFLGETENSVSQAQMEAVIGELTNVVCGSMLSASAPDGSFDLSTPQVQEVWPGDPLPMRQSFRSDSGAVLVSLSYQFPPKESNAAANPRPGR